MLPFVLLLPLATAAPVVDPFTEPDDSELYKLDEQIVTVAARYAQTVQDAPAIVTVITDRELRERGFRTLSDALRSLPGVYVTSSKESRKIAWFRGVISADDNKILLLVDGVPWYDGVYTHAWIDEYLPLENVRQIEIIKGPGSTIYGTNAFSGVINVVTYSAEELSGGFVRVVGGTSAKRGISAVAGHPFSSVDGGITAYARYQEADGDGLEVSPRGHSNASGDDPKRAINAGFHLELGNFDLRLDAIDYRHTYYTNDQDDPFDVLLQNEDDFWLAYHDQLASASYAIPLGQKATLTPRLAWRRHDDPGQYAFFGNPITSAATDPDSGETTYTTTWDTTLVETEKRTEAFTAGIDLEARPSPAHVFIAGVGGEALAVEQIQDITYEDLDHTGLVGRYEADPTTILEGFAYAQDTWTALPFLELTAGARLDYHAYYGAFPSPRAGVLLLPSDDVVLKVLYGRAFRAPTAREFLVTVSQDEEGKNDFTAGNPELRPESINTVETELSVRPTRALKLRAAAFYSSVTDEINKVTPNQPDPKLGDDYYDNSGGSDIFGGEAEGQVTAGPWDAQASYSFTYATDRDTGFQQYEFPAHMAHARVGWKLVDALRASVLVDVIGPRTRENWSPDAGAKDAPAYALVGAALATDALGGRVRVDVSTTNLLNTEYTTWLYRDDANETSDGEAKYPVDPTGEGRAVQVGVEVDF